ncbi:hypothetical protein TNCV_1154771 [Trichonephila clavipes]|nr:hypothetical protein TNCV_1154771 [Trichonephila clavipes]
MATRNNRNAFTRGRMIGKLNYVAQEFRIDKSVTSRTWKAFQMAGTAKGKAGGGRPMSSDWYIVPQAKRGQNQTTFTVER